ncbi:MAG: DUF1318 domain-containing protein [Candidatus Brocadia sp. WS118]|nr:MAG: DUF1318 domain-containing protein [Candidatus Brocadia sp. WS118]
MKIKICVSFLIVMLIGVVLMCNASRAQDLSAIKIQMEKRRSLIVELKHKEIVGEDMMGYLQFIGGKREKEDIVQAENQDRRTVYEAIAKKEGATTEQVGQRRALQIANQARKGVWLQGQNGKWYQK